MERGREPVQQTAGWLQLLRNLSVSATNHPHISKTFLLVENQAETLPATNSSYACLLPQAVTHAYPDVDDLSHNGGR